MRLVRTLAMLLAAIAPIWALLLISPWLLLVGYVVLLGVWALMRVTGEAFAGFLWPSMPMGVALPNPALLGELPSGGRFHWLSTQATKFLAALVEIGLWPAAALSGRTLHTVRTGAARVLTPGFGTYAVLSALFAVTLIGARAWSGPSTAFTVAAVALLVTLTARHLLWILSGQEFRRLLKRSRPSPYGTLVTLAVFDFIAILGVAIVLRWKATDAFDMQWAVAEGRDLLSLRHFTRLPARNDLSPAVVVLAAAVAAYYAALASQIIKVLDFRRDPDDRAWLAALLLNGGHVDEASTFLRSVPTQHFSGPALQMRIRLALVRAEYDDALALSRNLTSLLDLERASDEGAIVYLTTQMATMPALPGAAAEIVHRACTAKVSDAAMFVVLRNLQSSGVGVFEDWKDQLTALGLTPESYPIAWSLLQRSTGASEDAIRTLEAANPANEIDLMVREIATQDAVRQHRAFRTSRDDTRQQLNDMLRVFSPIRLEQLPLWLRQFLVQNTWRLEHRCRSFRLACCDDLRTIRRRLLAMPVKTADAVLDDLDATERARFKASRTGFDSMFGDSVP